MLRTRRHIILFALLSIFATAGVWSCRKDVNEFHTYPISLADLDPLLMQVPGPATTTVFSFNGPVPDTALTTQNGIQVFLTDTENLFANDNAVPVPCSTCQNFSVEIIQVSKKGDMIAWGLPGVSNEGELIESGGMVRVNVFCDGQPLQLLPGRNLKIHIPNSNQFPDLTLFKGLVQNDSLGSWQNTGEPIYLADWISPINSQMIAGYELIVSELGWVNCGRFLNEPTSTLCVELPTGFSELNTRAYIVFKNILVVAPLTPNGNGQFCFDKAPIGYPVKLVTIGKLGDQYWLGNKETEIGTNATLNFSPQQLSEQQVLGFLQGL